MAQGWYDGASDCRFWYVGRITEEDTQEEVQMNVGVELAFTVTMI